MEMTQEQIARIVEETLRALKAPAGVSAGSSGRWLCDTADEAVENAKGAASADGHDTGAAREADCGDAQGGY